MGSSRVSAAKRARRGERKGSTNAEDDDLVTTILVYFFVFTQDIKLKNAR